MSSQKSDNLKQTLYRHGLSLAVLFDLLVQKGILTREEIRMQARVVNQELLSRDRDEKPQAPLR